jgi:hypothetical protein
MTSREAFEAWSLSVGLCRHAAGTVRFDDAAWAAWQARDAEIAALRDVLDWYRDEAEALAKHMQGGAHTQAVLASLTVLSLDGGSRARAAIDAQRKL